MKVNECIREYRKKAGLTQEQVANHLGITAPAVNKWEKGGSYPDITLLPSLARLLNIDMNTLFSFKDELTELEISAFINDLTRTALDEDIDAAFQMAEEKIREYPHCDQLVHMAAMTLKGSLILSKGKIDSGQQEEYEQHIDVWFAQAAQSPDNNIRCSALHMLACRAIHNSKYEQAEHFIEQLPEMNQFDKPFLQANLLFQKGETDAAAEIIERVLLQTLTKVQGCLYRLIDAEELTGHHDEADRIGEIAQKMVGLFDLWSYGAVTPHLILALYRKDAENSLRLLSEVFEESKKPWNMKTSPLYYRIAGEELYNDFGERYIQALLAEAETEKEYEFLRDNENFRALLEKYKV